MLKLSHINEPFAIFLNLENIGVTCDARQKLFRNGGSITIEQIFHFLCVGQSLSDVFDVIFKTVLIVEADNILVRYVAKNVSMFRDLRSKVSY